MDTLTKNNRLFYWGILIVIIALVIYLYSLFSYEPPTDEKSIKILIPDYMLKK
jgi:hypothetical protein